VEATKQKEETKKKPKPEERESMPRHQHCPPAKRRGDSNPEYHEELKSNIPTKESMNSRRTPPQKRRKET
jgi:hypothetical protein